MEVFLLTVMIFTVLLYPLTNWIVEEYLKLFENSINRSFLLSLFISINIALLMSVLSTGFAIKEVIEAYK